MDGLEYWISSIVRRKLTDKIPPTDDHITYFATYLYGPLTYTSFKEVTLHAVNSYSDD